MPDKTLTEALASGQVVEIYRGLSAASFASFSSAREIPYAEVYRERTGIVETPIERMQRAAEDEARRAKNRRQ